MFGCSKNKINEFKSIMKKQHFFLTIKHIDSITIDNSWLIGQQILWFGW
jgi:hypothetical protein